MNSRQQIRHASRVASRGVPQHRRIDSVIGWAGCLGLAILILIDLAGRFA